MSLPDDGQHGTFLAGQRYRMIDGVLEEVAQCPSRRGVANASRRKPCDPFHAADSFANLGSDLAVLGESPRCN